jgi:hypothetical protein
MSDSDSPPPVQPDEEQPWAAIALVVGALAVLIVAAVGLFLLIGIDGG